ncbi:MAG TPA: plasmid pRiA4b ORF-3 family protein [Thermomicrobiales bacterium]|nr:plasmid pRiA4b ORF-3 family protein [Thermomicrobiales bacterium]
MPRPQGPSVQSRVRDALRGAGPLTVDEILARLNAVAPLVSKNPKQTVRNALTNPGLCQPAGENRYVDLPTYIKGAGVRVNMANASPSRRMLVVGPEVYALLWSLAIWGQEGPEPAIALAGGPTVKARREGHGWFMALEGVVLLPPRFWQWWEERAQAGADALHIRCEDAEAGRFTAAPVRAADLDAAAVAERNVALREAAADALNRGRTLRPDELARRLLARGVYHADPAPDPLDLALLEPPSPFVVEEMGIVVYRPDLTPALRRLFEPRIAEARYLSESFVREQAGLPALPEPPEPAPAPPAPAAARGYRLKVALAWDRKVWRAIEILDNQTLDDLHLAIQRAFDWDNDHLYAFFMSGRAWDRLTEIESPFGDAEPPTTDEVRLAELGLQPRQKFLYLFDFGDQLRHDIEVQRTFPAPPAPGPGAYPQVVETHGEAPAQYPDAEEWDEADVTWGDEYGGAG